MFAQAKNTLTSDQYNELYRWYLSELQQPISAEFKDVAYNTPDFVMQVNLRNSIASFAAYKEYHYIEALNAALFDSNGKPVGKQAFLKAAKAISSDFNKRFLSVEYDTAQAKAQSAAQWLDIERNADVAPWLVYDTAGDGRVRPAHALLNGVTKRYDDPWWSNHTPPLGFGCRCGIGQVTDGTETKNKDIPAVVVTPGFGSNPLTKPVVFNELHPYFSKIKESDRELVKILSEKMTFDIVKSTETSVLMQSKRFVDVNKERVIATLEKLVTGKNRMLLVADGYFNIDVNPEVEFNGKIADVKHFNAQPVGKSTELNKLASAEEQRCELAIIDFEEWTYDEQKMRLAISRAKNSKEFRNGYLKEVIVIHKNGIQTFKMKKGS